MNHSNHTRRIIWTGMEYNSTMGHLTLLNDGVLNKAFVYMPHVKNIQILRVSTKTLDIVFYAPFCEVKTILAMLYEAVVTNVNASRESTWPSGKVRARQFRVFVRLHSWNLDRIMGVKCVTVLLWHWNGPFSPRFPQRTWYFICFLREIKLLGWSVLASCYVIRLISCTR